MILGLQGYAGSGKSTVAEYLVRKHGFARRHIKTPIAEMARVLFEECGIDDTGRWIDGEMKRAPILELGGRTSTEIQQFLGTEFGRGFLSEDVWLDLWYKWAAMQECHVVQESVRFANEAMLCDEVLEIRRPGCGPHNSHVSENLVVLDPTHTLVNDGTIQDLYDQIDEIVPL